MAGALKPVLSVSWLMIIVVTGYVLVVGRSVLIPLMLAVLLWQLVNAIAKRFKRLRIRGQTAPTWLAILLAVITLGLGLALVVEMILRNVGDVAAAAPAYQENLRRLAASAAGFLDLEPFPSIADIASRLNIAGVIGMITGTFGNLIGNLGLVLLYVAFLLAEQESFDRKIDALFARPGRALEIRTLLGHIEQRIERYIWIKTVISAATGFLTWVVLVLVGADFPEFWSVVVFMLNFIPTLGSIMGVVFPTLLALLQFGEPGPVIAVAVGLGLVQFTLGNVLEPRLMGSSLNLSPMVMIVSLSLWGSLWGIAGMFLCVPIMVSLMIICAEFEQTRPIAVALSATGRID